MKHRKTYSLPASPSLLSSSLPSPISSCEPPDSDFIELIARSNFSFLQGASHPEELVLTAKRLGYKGLAICDVNGLYGIVRGYQAAEKPSAFDAEQLATSKLSDGSPATEFHYLCGAELTLFDSSNVVLLPMNKDGYRRLCHLITLSKRRSPKGAISVGLEDILNANEDLILFPLPPWNKEHLLRLQTAFQDRIYLPIHKDLTWESNRLYQEALHLEHELGLPLFATQRPLFHDPSRKPLHDVLTCILHQTTLTQAATRLSLNRERHLKSTRQIAELFRDRPDLIRRTWEIAARVNFSLSELRYRYPQETLPPGKSAAEFLRELVEQGLKRRYPPNDNTSEFLLKVRKQVEHELKLIHEMEYEDYFLTLWDICQFAKSRGILHQGRGSAANSVVCFTLGLTNVDPVRMELLFERFLSRERGEPPDIDIDFEHQRREEVIQYIYKKYGERHAAMVCTVITYRSRMAMREAAKVMGLALPQVNALIKHMGREGLSQLIANPGDITKFGLNEERFKLLLKIALELQGFPRHLGIHTGGFVISHEPVIDIVPVESATMDKRYVIQWNKDDINTLGLMKIDVLSLGMLTAIRRTLDLLKSHKGIDWNMAQVPQDDRETYEMIQKAETIGVFQIESRAQMSLLPRLRPKNYYDLVIQVAIVRPGPIQGGMVHPFLRRRSGREKETYAHESLRPILKRTLGIPLFQEQVMQIVVAAAGFTPGEADELRRIMSAAWRKPAVMDGLRRRVINGMLNHQLSRSYAEQIYKTIEGFASYGFPESHAASFALITYVSCYLKRHHPDAFTCSLLNSQPMGFYPPRQLIAEAQRNGVHFLPLDVQFSEWDYTLVEQRASLLHAVRTGFRSVYGLREDHAQTIIQAREQSGVFLGLTDFVKRTRLPRQVLVRLAAAGALQCFGHSPRETLWLVQGMELNIESLLFASTPLTDSSRSDLALIPFESDWQKVHREYETTGFSIDHHPMAVLRPALRHKPHLYTTAQKLKELRHRSRLRIAGLVSLLQKPPTAKGMCFISLEDETGLFNVVITPELYQKSRLVLQHTPLLEFEGWLESHQGVYNVKATAIRPLSP